MLFPNSYNDYGTFDEKPMHNLDELVKSRKLDVGLAELSQAMTKDEAQRSRWSLAELSQAFYEVVKVKRKKLEGKGKCLKCKREETEVRMQNITTTQ